MMQNQTELPDEAAEREALAQDYLDLAHAALDLARREDFAQPGPLEKAAHCLMRALELKPDFLEALLAVAYLSAQLGLQQRAADALDQASLLAPGDPRIAVLRKEVQGYFSRMPARPELYLAEEVLRERILPVLLAGARSPDQALGRLDFLNPQA